MLQFYILWNESLSRGERYLSKLWQSFFMCGGFTMTKQADKSPDEIAAENAFTDKFPDTSVISIQFLQFKEVFQLGLARRDGTVIQCASCGDSHSIGDAMSEFEYNRAQEISKLQARCEKLEEALKHARKRLKFMEENYNFESDPTFKIIDEALASKELTK
jgi:hypothetical protein